MRVLIAGAGPGGSLAAVLLARQGHDVVLVDRSEFPRDKACGDVIGPRALAVLKQADITLPAHAHRIGSMVLGFEAGQITLPARPGLGHGGYGVTIRRREFDDLLHREAERAGATTRVGVVTKVTRAGRRLSVSVGSQSEDYELVVGADGANSTVARSMGLMNADRALMGFALRRHVLGATREDRVDLFLEQGDTALPGYGWVFDQGDGRLNLGIGVGIGTQRTRAKGARELLERYQRRLQAQGIVTITGSPSEMGGWLKMGLIGQRVADDGVFLVGDAAGLVNPLQGEGIAAALLSATLCASAIDRYGANGAGAYRSEIQDHFGAFLSTGYLAQRIALSHPRVARIAMRTLMVAGRYDRIASAWGLFWNDLTEYSGSQTGSLAARTMVHVGAAITQGVLGSPEWLG